MTDDSGNLWRKSSFSVESCVQYTELRDGSVGVRDSKDPNGPKLQFNRKEWKAFVDGVKAGEFDV